MAPPRLPTLSEVIQKLNLRAKSSLGQNFLLDSNIHQKIARACAPEGLRLMEIGAGPGGLTRALLEAAPEKLFAVEIDKRAIPALVELQTHYPNALEILEQDGLLVSPNDYRADKIVGNLPFNIASPLLARWLLEPQPVVKKIIVLVQKEVAGRITAHEGNKTFGRLSLLCQWRGAAKMLFTIPARAFTPVPKVDCALVEISLQPKPDDPKPSTIDWLSRLAFSQRRKMLRTHIALRPLLETLGIDATLRAEQLSVGQYRQLAQEKEKL